jgi:hypothetical protein
MVTQTDWFTDRDKDLPKPKYNYGDRVFAKLGKMPLVGMVIREVNSTVLIHSDLPLMIENQFRHIVAVPIKNVSLLMEIK